MNNKVVIDWEYCFFLSIKNNKSTIIYKDALDNIYLSYDIIGDVIKKILF